MMVWLEDIFLASLLVSMAVIAFLLAASMTWGFYMLVTGGFAEFCR
jgi:hypothetical protein